MKSPCASLKDSLLQNGFVEYEAVKRAGIASARAHLAAAFPDGLALESAFVAPELAAQARTHPLRACVKLRS